MITPATAGPVMRATLKSIALSPMALVRDSGGTESETIEARDGCWKVCTEAMKMAVR